MEQTPDIFRRGKEAYERLLDDLHHLYTLLPISARKELFLDKSKKINNDKDSTGYKNMCKYMNFLLQDALLEIGTLDDKASYLEMLYVADIGDFGTRIDHYLASTTLKSDRKFAKFTYLMLPDNNESGKEEIIYFRSCIHQFVEPIHEKMLKAFYIIQHVSKDDEKMQDIFPNLIEVYDAFLHVDKRIEKEDPMIAAKKLKEYFFEHINDYKNKVSGLLK